MTSPVKALILGAGYRGRAYAEYATLHPEQLQIVGVADPFQAETIPSPRYWKDWRECLAEHPEADLVLICTPDDLHYEPAMQALEAGYHLILEKPLSPTEAECREIVAKALEKERLVMVGHVLRYTRPYAHIKAILDSGELGEVVTIHHQESMGYWKVAHSYTRGIWAKESSASPVILAKCSHDFDLFSWWIGEPCERVSSFASPPYFRAENRPAGAPARCSDCPAHIAKDCIWDARKLYLEQEDLRYLFADPSLENMRRVVETSPYGRCVYACDNDVPDRQTVMCAFKGGALVSHTMTGFTAENVRITRIACTKGEIICRGENVDDVEVCKFDGSHLRTGIPPAFVHTNPSRHGGGDLNLVAETLRLLLHGTPEERRTTTLQALQSHLICFTAERSRHAGGAPMRVC